MKSTLLSALLALCTLPLLATSDPVSAYDPLEVSFYNPKTLWDVNTQQMLRYEPAWQAFTAQHDNWYVYFNETNGQPHRAYGKAIPTMGATIEQRAWNFISTELSGFDLPVEELNLRTVAPAKDLTYVHFDQVHDGHQVLNGGFVLKFWNDQIIMWGADTYTSITASSEATLDAFTAQLIAEGDMTNTIVATEVDQDLGWVALPGAQDVRLVYQVLVKTANANGVPANYYTLVDAHSGEVLYRQNRVKHITNCPKCNHPEKKAHSHDREVRTMGMMDVDGSVSAEVYPTSILEDTETLGLPHLTMNLGGASVTTDANGSFASDETGPVNASIPLSGLWCDIYTDGNQPSFTTTLADGNNLVSFDGEANIRELSAYRSTNIIHDHVNVVLPDWDGMDFSLTTNIDVSGECNAFYDGASINFYNIGGGCNATSLLADVVYHEYGHGINNEYYQDNGGFFNNGSMNEGYADFWAIQISNNPNLGQGFFTDDVDGIRRYDVDPQVYPVDIADGDVHGNGEIICGAWWDTHLLMGEDWETTLPLWVQAYPGLQATAFNGNEGEAFTDVLLDVLQADDDNGDISDGSPNGFAIIEGFDIHGITLLANADFEHADILAAEADETITIEASLDVTFPFSEYIEAARLFYRVNEGAITEVDMVNVDGDDFSAEIPGQEPGTLIEYYLGTLDIYGNVANVLPVGSNLDDPNVRYYIIVGATEIETHDNDLTEDWGPWETGVAGDLATTGQWEVNFPIGSTSGDGTDGPLVAPNSQVTPGIDGELCFLTEQSGSFGDSMGTNDVDGGHTTLRSPVIDLTGREHPIFSYWRWYVNAPAGGANPGTDWWQVQISDDGGDSWVFIEETRTQENNWRRKAFRVEDFVEINDQFRIQMIASDSVFVGENLDGGSLIEAAVDDIFLWDLPSVGVEEQADAGHQWSIFPNPSEGTFTLNYAFEQPENVQVEITNAVGQVIFREVWNQAQGNRTLHLDGAATGLYHVRMTRDGVTTVKPLQIIAP